MTFSRGVGYALALVSGIAAGLITNSGLMAAAVAGLIGGIFALVLLGRAA